MTTILSEKAVEVTSVCTPLTKPVACLDRAGKASSLTSSSGMIGLSMINPPAMMGLYTAYVKRAPRLESRELVRKTAPLLAE